MGFGIRVQLFWGFRGSGFWGLGSEFRVQLFFFLVGGGGGEGFRVQEPRITSVEAGFIVAVPSSEGFEFRVQGWGFTPQALNHRP